MPTSDFARLSDIYILLVAHSDNERRRTIQLNPSKIVRTAKMTVTKYLGLIGWIRASGGEGVAILKSTSLVVESPISPIIYTIPTREPTGS
ncbi:hypothetical protein M404DRAFT_1005723 [Pisolithus tinctorius Marx 270]|uniref:Uncharacterized protein n=1 Tax=Pisolithus tinctorius Marx 270 TaxID=870435 RepID=A0A0C3NA82_PISTI|nr:hypothetical protein M404DRAFT_1005723 [Pisolithus tinctorius Marx 270]